MGVETRLKTGDVQAIPMFEHALELDPNFAARGGAPRRDLHEPARSPAGAAVHEARVRAQRVAQRARAPLHQVALPLHRHRPAGRCGRPPTGCGSPRIRTTGCRTATCRRPTCALNRLEEAVDEARTAVRLAPDSVFAYQQLTRTLLALGSLPEARAVDPRRAVEGARLVGHSHAGVRPRVHRQGRRRHAGAPARRRVLAPTVTSC